MISLGLQILADFYECDSKILDDKDFIEKSMLEAAKRCGATIISYNFHKFSPQGVSGIIVIAESHLAIHTWPEHKFAAIDLFTCGQSLKPDLGFNYLIEALRSRHQTINSINRGYQANLLKKD